MTLAGLLGPGATTRDDIAAYLDALRAEQRTAECLELSGPQQKRLWAIASAAPGVPQELTGKGGQAVFAGRNTLRLFTRFEKRFALLDGAVVGYNRTSLGWLIGPGYFTVGPAPGGLLFDYRQVPNQAPSGWPRVKPNTGAASRAVYGGLLDDVVWVARDVLIGSARRGEIPLGSYFVLSRT